VLLIEDNADARQMMRFLLERAGHVVYEEVDGLRGIEAATRLNPDVAIVDIGLPGLDGYAVARQVRLRLGREIRLVALTGYGRAGDRDRAIGAGFDMYVVKPIEPAALQEIVGQSRAD
jgi:CheY-like chemotaxis protein